MNHAEMINELHREVKPDVLWWITSQHLSMRKLKAARNTYNFHLEKNSLSESELLALLLRCFRYHVKKQHCPSQQQFFEHFTANLNQAVEDLAPTLSAYPSLTLLLKSVVQYVNCDVSEIHLTEARALISELIEYFKQPSISVKPKAIAAFMLACQVCIAKTCLPRATKWLLHSKLDDQLINDGLFLWSQREIALYWFEGDHGSYANYLFFYYWIRPEVLISILRHRRADDQRGVIPMIMFSRKMSPKRTLARPLNSILFEAAIESGLARIGQLKVTL